MVAQPEARMPRRRPPSHPQCPESPFGGTCADYAHNLLGGSLMARLERGSLRYVEHLGLLRAMAESARPSLAGKDIDRSELIDALRTYRRGAGTAPRPPAPLGPPARMNLHVLAARVGLDPVAQDVLRFCLSLEVDEGLRELVSALGTVVGLDSAVTTVSTATARYPREVRRAVAPSGRLVASGLVTLAKDRTDVRSWFELMPGLSELVAQDVLPPDALLTRFLPAARPTDLEWQDFQHIDAEARLAGNLLKAAVRARQPGVNILLYGASGTGKTSMASLLAREAGAALHQAGRANESGESPSARERLTSLLLGQKLLGGGAVVLFDEMEDLCEQSPLLVRGRDIGPARPVSKQWFNLLLETNAVPIVWTTNSLEGVDRAVLRRFSYAVEFTRCGATQRARVLERHLSDAHNLSESDIAAVAERFSASPAHLASAISATRLLCGEAGPDRPTLEAVLAPIERLVEGRALARRAVFDPRRWSAEGLNCSVDPVELADRLVCSQNGRPPSRDLPEGTGLSVCLYGRPGTGKSEYVRYLAWRLGRPVIVRRVSDILSKWVGEAERLIAEAFRAAENDGAVLLFDEADTFLRSRSQARQSWEVSQVNEFLQQLESSRGLVACTTNLWQDLDEAALRRFTFKIEFRWLETKQAAAVFRTLLGPVLDRALGPSDDARLAADLGRLDKLAPGDFAVLARRVRATTGTADLEALLQGLAEEVRVKSGAAGRVGF